MRALPLIALIAAAVLSGCGGEEQTTAAPTPSPPAAATQTPATTPTATPTPTATDAPTPQNPEDQPGGAGDEEPIRVPVELTIGSEGGITPAQVSVPAFLSLELIVHNRTPSDVVVRLEGAKPLTVPAGGTGRETLEGRKKGSYVIDAGGAGQALLVTGVEPGP